MRHFGDQCHCALISEVRILGDAAFTRTKLLTNKMVSVAQSLRVRGQYFLANSHPQCDWLGGKASDCTTRGLSLAIENGDEGRMLLFKSESEKENKVTFKKQNLLFWS